MRNFFDTQSLSRYFSVQNSQQRLALVGSNIAKGNPLFERLLLNDEHMRERAKVIKDGVELHREHMSSMISKVQTLQARLQTIYQSMLDRYMMTSSTKAGTPQDQSDPWDVDKWKSAGRAPLLFSRGANVEEDSTDPLGAGPTNLSRLHYKRPVDNGPGWDMYEERGGYYTSLAYLWDWDLHQLRYTYATGTTPYTPEHIHDDKILEVTAVDFNKIPPRQWRAGDLITLDPNKVFTPEFLSAGYGNSDIDYQNGSGYQFGGNITLYAYVREVEYLPDGIIKPVTIDIVKSKNLTDADGDGIPDDTVKLNDFLTAIGNEGYSMRLTAEDYAGSGIDLVGASGPGPNTTGWNNYYQGASTYWNHQNLAGSPVDTIWAGSTHQQWNLWTKDMTITTSDIDILKHPSLEYSGFATLYNDDDGTLFVSKDKAAWNFPVGDTYDQTWNINDWVRLGRDAGGGAGSWDGTNIRALESMWLDNNENLSFYYRASSKPYSGSTENAGVAIVGDLNVKTIAGQDNKDRYYVDRFGNIFDKYGTGNASDDHYDYIPDIDTNATANYVGNIFGANSRKARTMNLDGSKGGNKDGQLDVVESTPWLSLAQRNYNDVDEPTKTPTPGSMVDGELDMSGSTGAPTQANYQDSGELGINTYNPQFGGIYLGFAEKDYTSVGKANVVKDAWGRSTNTIKFKALRTGLSSGYANDPTNYSDLIDRDYNAIASGTTVRILDAHGNQVAFGTIGAKDANNEYTVSNMRDAASGGNAVVLDPNKTYTITTDVDHDARLGGSMENQLAVVLQNSLKGAEYREALKYGLLDDLIISATAVTPFGDQMTGRITIGYNRQQERIEIYQNAFSAFYKSTKF